MSKDSTKTLGASNHSLEERSMLDYYGTDPRSTNALLGVESFCHRIWEPCAGHHLIVDELAKAGYDVLATDIADYGFGDRKVNFLEADADFDGDIVTNPPYGLSTEFAVKALEIVKPGRKVAMFLRLLFLEGSKRYDVLFKNNPPKTVYVFSNRQVADRNDDFTKGSSVAYAWFVWEKGYMGETSLKWLSTK